MRPSAGLPELTLGYEVADWIERNCAVPDGDLAGEPFEPSDEQLRFLAWYYAVDKDGRFVFRRAQLVRPQKWGKGPLGAAIICAEAAGPVLVDYFGGDGQPRGRSWPTPWIQVVAVSEDQTDNVWTALVPMIELGELKAEISDTGKTRINVRGAHGSRGLIEPVTSAAVSRLGQRLTFALHDETHAWNPQNGGVKLADTQRRNLAGMGGRSLETTNAWDPSEASVAQTTCEADLPDVLIDYPLPPKGSIGNKRERRKVLRAVYAGAPWVDLDRIDAEIEELLPRDPRQAERFFLNRIVAGSDKAFDAELWASKAVEGTIEAGRKVALGFDGSRREDETGLVATDIETGFQQVVGHWRRPDDWPADVDYEIPEHEVTGAVEYCFDEWDVWRLYADPPYWESTLDAWAGRWGAERVIRWWTNRPKMVALALKAWVGDWPSTLSHDGSPALQAHIANAVKQPTKIRDGDTGAWLWVIRKDGPKSPRKIDLAMAALLSWECRGDAIAAGVMNEPVYSRATF